MSVSVVAQGLLLAEALAHVGVKVGRVTVAVGTGNTADHQQRRLLHTISSAPMRDILRDTMQPSDNLYAVSEQRHCASICLFSRYQLTSMSSRTQ